MNKTERAIYRTLIDLPREGYGLCNICRYALWVGGCCEEADLECHCGIVAIEEGAEDIWQGRDCWVFRPKYNLADTVDMVGIFLQGLNPDMSKCRDFIPKKMKVLTQP